jgi:AsmA protein
MTDGAIHYANAQSGAGFDAAPCTGDLHRFQLVGGKRADFVKNLSFTAEVTCGEFGKNDVTVPNLKISVNAKGGVFDLDPFSMPLFGAQGLGSMHADLSGAIPQYQIRYSLPQFRIEEFFKTLAPQKVAEGAMDFSAALSMHGLTVTEVKQSMQGVMSLRGVNVMLLGNDLDAEFARFESSQNFNLVDVGAFFVAGPLGVVVTKGYNFASLFQGSGGSSEIQMLVSDWTVENGIAQAQDVAMATNENRVAARGGLDFVNDQFVDATVALIDDKGCASARQKVHGTFQEPVVEKPDFIHSLAGPALELLKKGRSIFPGSACEVFYEGSVAPPT